MFKTISTFTLPVGGLFWYASKRKDAFAAENPVNIPPHLQEKKTDATCYVWNWDWDSYHDPQDPFIRSQYYSKLYIFVNSGEPSLCECDHLHRNITTKGRRQCEHAVERLDNLLQYHFKQSPNNIMSATDVSSQQLLALIKCTFDRKSTDVVYKDVPELDEIFPCAVNPPFPHHTPPDKTTYE